MHKKEDIGACRGEEKRGLAEVELRKGMILAERSGQRKKEESTEGNDPGDWEQDRKLDAGKRHVGRHHRMPHPA